MKRRNTRGRACRRHELRGTAYKKRPHPIIFIKMSLITIRSPATSTYIGFSGVFCVFDCFALS
jgi:hypothetical protein